MPIITLDGNRYEVETVESEENSRLLLVDGKEVRVQVLRHLSDDPLTMLVRTGDRVARVVAARKDSPDRYDVLLNEKMMTVTLQEEEGGSGGPAITTLEGPVVVYAPMAGKIASMSLEIGSPASEGQTVLVLEAMKMENEIAAPKKGTVKEIYVQPGALVKAGEKLLLIQ